MYGKIVGYNRKMFNEQPKKGKYKVNIYGKLFLCLSRFIVFKFK